MLDVIGFIGLAGAGKDTAARAMQAEFLRKGRAAYVVGFADPIRTIAQYVDLNPYARELKECPCSFDLDVFCDRFWNAIHLVLGAYLNEHTCAKLYAYTMEALNKRISQGGSASRIDISPRQFMQALGTEGGHRVRPGLWVEIAEARWEGLDGYVLVTDVRFETELRLLRTLYLVTRKGLTSTGDTHASEQMAARLTKEGMYGPTALRLPVAMRALYNGRSKRHLEKKATWVARHRLHLLEQFTAPWE